MRKTLIILVWITFTGCTNNSGGMETERVSITGIARNAKAGAILHAGQDSIYYIDGLDYWEEELLARKIIVTGNLIEKTISTSELKNENGEWSAGLSGKIKIIEKAKWKIER